MTAPTHGFRQLTELLIALFDAGELQRFIAFLPYGQELRAALPSGSPALNHLAFDCVQAIDKRGYLDHAFFDALVQERPRRRSDIDAVRVAVLGDMGPAASQDQGDPAAAGPGAEPKEDSSQDSRQGTRHESRHGYRGSPRTEGAPSPSSSSSSSFGAQPGQPRALRWLHLSDLHAGSRGRSVFNQLLEDLEADIAQMSRRMEAPDLIFFTGDLAFSGREYDAVDEVLTRIAGWLQRHYPRALRPLLFAVPGNHDLQRPEGVSKLSYRILRHYHEIDDPDVQLFRRALWQQTPPDNELIESLFTDFRDWHHRCVVEPLKADPRCTALYSSPVMPGDLTAVIQIPAAGPGSPGTMKLALTGLNSSWLQYDGSDMEGKLHLPIEQLHAALPEGDPLSLFRECEAAFLLMHHPPNWLSREGLLAFQRDIYPPGRFDLCLFGHMHAGMSTMVASGGSASRLYMQSPSLFGLEKYGTRAEDRAFGYSWGEVDPRGGIRIWPRRHLVRRSGKGAFDRDQDFEHHGDDATWLRRSKEERS